MKPFPKEDSILVLSKGRKTLTLLDKVCLILVEPAHLPELPPPSDAACTSEGVQQEVLAPEATAADILPVDESHTGVVSETRRAFRKVGKQL